ncbi:DUF5134 domain-containing protein [Streptomonospora sp. DSM 45055]|uniref:DUF5134 domain-containing protein n=2 Tax=Streptomonospora wellingtoniae TaxID=3075544 RepID=A0ABU2KUV2_9ACTN|nr:DUF5134 domain-containing protein [Streptomonospora sp. DSM 45055]MDT0303042.1 DUF5134 domain-containing protein [Streptomonospora sp. DSM 45055]
MTVLAGAGHGAHTAALPDWVRVGFAVVLAGVAVVHLRHGAQMSRQRRWWHAGHAVMALGMAAMYLLPRMHYEGLHRSGLVLFALLAAATAVAALGLRSREGALNPVWTMSALDYLAMTYMLADPAVRPGWLAYVFAAYFGCAALGWVARAFDRLPVFAHPVAAAGAGAGAAAGVGGGTATGGPALLSAHPAGGPGGAPARSRMSVALTLAAMAAAMAFMLVAM